MFMMGVMVRLLARIWSSLARVDVLPAKTFWMICTSTWFAGAEMKKPVPLASSAFATCQGGRMKAP